MNYCKIKYCCDACKIIILMIVLVTCSNPDHQRNNFEAILIPSYPDTSEIDTIDVRSSVLGVNLNHLATFYGLPPNLVSYGERYDSKRRLYTLTASDQANDVIYRLIIINNPYVPSTLSWIEKNGFRFSTKHYEVSKIGTDNWNLPILFDIKGQIIVYSGDGCTRVFINDYREKTLTWLQFSDLLGIDVHN